jgi:hypothetical protein
MLHKTEIFGNSYEKKHEFSASKLRYFSEGKNKIENDMTQAVLRGRYDFL